MAEFILGPALAIGFLIGAYEAIVIHRDVSVPTHRFGHMIHALLLSTIFVFISMNVDFVLSYLPGFAAIPILGSAIGIRLAVGILAAVKVHGVSRVIKTKGAGGGTGLGETWFHSILVGGLIIAAPYLYPFIEPAVPNWLKF